MQTLAGSEMGEDPALADPEFGGTLPIVSPLTPSIEARRMAASRLAWWVRSPSDLR